MISDVASMDVTAAELYADGAFPHEVFDDLRSHDPVFFHEDSRYGPFWSLTSYEAVRAANRDPETFCSGQGMNLRDTPEQLPAMKDLLVYMDPPRHTRLRKLVNKGFTPSRVAAMEDAVRELCRTMITELRAVESWNLTEDMTALFPVRVIAQLIGIDEVDRHRFNQWGIDLLIDPTTPEGYETVFTARTQVYALADALFEQKRRSPADDMASVLVAATEGEDALTNSEFQEFILLLILAGFETTRNLLSHGTLRLLSDRALLDAFVTEPTMIPAAVEEMLRYRPSLVAHRRTATRDVEFFGHQIRKGDAVALWFAAANRDPAEFVDPHTFDPRRTPNRHMAFGAGGPHFCLGAPLARLEGRVFFEEFAALLVDMELAGQAHVEVDALLDGVRSAPMRWKD